MTVTLIHHQGRTGRVDPEFPFPVFTEDMDMADYQIDFDLALSKVTWFDEKEENEVWKILSRMLFPVPGATTVFYGGKIDTRTDIEKAKAIFKEGIPFTVDLPEVVEQWQCKLPDQTIWEDSFCDSVSREKFKANGFQYRMVLRFKEEQK